MKFVLDTDVVLAGFMSPTGASAALLQFAHEGRFTMAISVPLAIEYEAVATRSVHLARMGVDAEFVEGLIDSVCAIAEKTQIDTGHRPQTRDPNDEMVLETAIGSRADAIVTFNRRDLAAAAKRYEIDCLLPREALEKVR